MRTPIPKLALPTSINGRSVVAWRRWAQLDDTHDIAVPIVQLGSGRATRHVVDIEGALKIPRVAPVAAASAPRFSAGTAVLLGAGVAIVGMAIYRSWMRGQRSADVINGYEAENVIADELEGAWGGAVDVSPGSRGAADLDAHLPIGRFAIQVKSSRRGEARWPRPQEIDELERVASRRRARAVVALRTQTETTYHDARTREPIDL